MGNVSRSEKSGLQLAENLPTVSPCRKYEREFEVTVMGLHCESRLCNNAFVENELINMTRAWDKEKILSPRQESIDPNSMQDTYHIWTQLDDLALHEFS